VATGTCKISMYVAQSKETQ